MGCKDKFCIGSCHVLVVFEDLIHSLTAYTDGSFIKTFHFCCQLLAAPLRFIRLQWPDGIFDVTWSEVNENALVCGAGDGKLLVVDQKCPQVTALL